MRIVYTLAACLLSTGCNVMASDNLIQSPQTTECSIKATSTCSVSDLTGAWQITSIELNKKNISIDKQARATFKTADTTQDRLAFYGSLGCNNISSSAQLAEDSLSFSRAMSTKMLCIDIMKAENAFLQIISEPIAVNIKGKSMTWISKSGQIMLRR